MSNSKAKLPYNLLIGASVLLAVVWILAGSGDPWDEGEHLRVASLMYHFGLRPFSDFFEHHFVYIWRLLGSYFYLFRLDPEPAVMFAYGRLLVLGAFVLSLAALWKISNHSNPKPAKASGRMFPISWALISLYVVAMRSMFVIRPESFAFALFLLAFAELVVGRFSKKSTLVAVVLFGLASAFTPRFVPAIGLVGAFLLIWMGTNPRAVGRAAIKSAVLILSSVAVAMLLLLGYLHETYVWAIRFTSAVQAIPSPNSPSFAKVLLLHGFYLGLVPVAILAGYALLGKEFFKNRSARILFATIVAILPVFAYSGFGNVFPQGYSPIAAAVLVAFAFLADSRLHRARPKVAIALAGLLILLSIAAFLRPQQLRNAVAYNVPVRTALSEYAEGRTGLFVLWEQPFNHKLPFYYASHLVCCADRSKAAIEKLRAQGLDVPPYDTADAILDTHPEIITVAWRQFVPKADQSRVEEVLSNCYQYFMIPFVQHCLLCGKDVRMARGVFMLKPQCRK